MVSYVFYTSEEIHSNEPRTFPEAIKYKDNQKWMLEMTEELNSLVKFWEVNGFSKEMRVFLVLNYQGSKLNW